MIDANVTISLLHQIKRNVAKISLDSFTALIAGVRACRQIKR